MEEAPMTWRSGGCHCGAVRFEVLAPEEIEAKECNCSICRMTGYLHLIVDADRFRLTKGADVPWEDEKFIYLAASRTPATAGAARIVAPPRAGKGRIGLKLCLPEGGATEEIFSKRDGEVFRSIRRLDWGDSLPAES